AIAGLIATSAALAVLVSLSQTPTGEATPPAAEAQTETVIPTPDIAPTTETITVVAPEQSVSELDDSISDALVASGYTEFVEESQLGSELDPTVARVLTDENAVLVIANDPGEG
ncbi:MAG: hypothetical protein ACR2NG_04485, partial [Acidimicrobiia bacterium]